MEQPPPPPPPPSDPPESQPPPADAGVQQHYGSQVPGFQTTNGMAVAALVSGILGLLICFGIGSVAALIFGYIARGQIKASQGRQSGNGMAVAGIVLGWIGVVLTAIFIAFLTIGSIALFNWAESEDLPGVVNDGMEFVAEGALEDISEADAGCTEVEKYPNQGKEHIAEGKTAQYNSSPPTSGPHYDAPAQPGFYEPGSGIEPERLVHNLEHGQIVIWYRPQAEDLGLLERQVEELVAQEPVATVGAPYPAMDERYNLVITSWTRSRACVHASQEVVDDFRRRFQGRAPEPLTPPFNG